MSFVNFLFFGQTKKKIDSVKVRILKVPDFQRFQDFQNKIKKKLFTKKMDIVYYKFLNAELNHNGFKYKLGLNVDTRKFNPHGSCQPGGLYFTNSENLYKFLIYGVYIADIVIPPDAEIYEEEKQSKWKADKITILKITPVMKHPLCTYDFLLRAVKYEGFALKNIPIQTHEMCIEACKQKGGAVHFVHDKTLEIWVEATKENGCVIQYITDKELKEKVIKILLPLLPIKHLKSLKQGQMYSSH